MKNMRATDSSRDPSTRAILALLVIHVLIALAARVYPQIATFHALVTLSIGLYTALFSRSSRQVALIAAYIVGAEIFWRMTNANVFWEYGKYAIIAILLIAFLRQKHMRNLGLPLVYFLLLTLSIPLTLFAHGLSSVSRQMISFNLSGPFALLVSVVFFSQIKLNEHDLQNIGWAVSIPLVSVLTLAFRSTVTASAIQFTTESNFTTSGGFGPNQVSAVLGLGAVMMFLILLTSSRTHLRLLAAFLMLAFLAQSALTFSRGGIINAAVCILIGSLHFLMLRRGKGGALALIFAMLLIGVYFLYPLLDQFTGGMLTKRFQETNLSGRTEIAQAEMIIFQDHPWLGVGPGEGAYQSVEYFGKYAAAHTEYTRLLAEHGIPGILAMLLLVIMAMRAYFRSPGVQSKLWAAVFLAWPLVEMSHAAMRVAAISFLFGLANAVWITDHEKPIRQKGVTNHGKLDASRS